MVKIYHKPVLTGASLISLLVVVAAHAAILYGMWQYRFSTTSPETITLYAQFIAPPEKQQEVAEAPKAELKAEHKPPQVKPKPPIRKVQPRPKRQLVAKAPVTTPQEQVIPEPPIEEHKPEPEPEKKLLMKP